MTVIKTGALAAFTIAVAYIIFRSPHGASAGIGFANLTPLFPRGAGGFAQAVVICTFAYGIGAFASATGDTENPRRDIPRATWGMAAGQTLFFTLPTLALLLSVPWTAISTGSSPFVTGLGHVGIHLGSSVLNAVVLISSFSALVASMYSAIIMLSSLARDREAPAFLSVKKNNLYLNALLSSSAALFILILLVQSLPRNIYNYSVTTTGYLSFVNWGFILLGRLLLCLPKRNSGRVEWSGLAVSSTGIFGILLISVLSLRAPEQNYSFALTLGILIMLGITGKYVTGRNSAGLNHKGVPKNYFSHDGKKEGLSLRDTFKRKLR